MLLGAWRSKRAEFYYKMTTLDAEGDILSDL